MKKVKFIYDKDSGSYSIYIRVCSVDREICIDKYMGVYTIWLDDVKVCDYIDSLSVAKEKVKELIKVLDCMILE